MRETKGSDQEKQNVMRQRGGVLVMLLFGIYAAFLLWITLLSRSQQPDAGVLPIFWSYRAILRGDLSVALEDAENVLLFIPLGYFVHRIFQQGKYKTLIIGFGTSFFIECIQLAASFGNFEVDDLIDNTLGTLIGLLFAVLVIRMRGEYRRKAPEMVNQLAVIAVCTILLVTVDQSYTLIHNLRMDQIAGQNDREDGAENLLVLYGRSGYIDGTEMYVEYHRDGSLTIDGSSDYRQWKRISEMTLEPGTYTLAGMSGVEEETIALEIEYYNEEVDAYNALAPDVGPVDEVTFTLTETEDVRIYIGVYAGASGHVECTPVLYREE